MTAALIANSKPRTNASNYYHKLSDDACAMEQHASMLTGSGAYRTQSFQYNPDGTQESLQALITKLVEDSKRLNRLGQNASKCIDQQHQPDNTNDNNTEHMTRFTKFNQQDKPSASHSVEAYGEPHTGSGYSTISEF